MTPRRAEVDAARASKFSRAVCAWFRKNGRALPWREPREVPGTSDWGTSPFNVLDAGATPTRTPRP